MSAIPDVPVRWFFKAVIQPVCYSLQILQPAMHHLLLGTAVHESNLVFERQIRGPAMGWFQMEPRTHDDLWSRFLTQATRRDLGGRIRELIQGQTPSALHMVANAPYACAMAAAFYRRVAEALPAPGDIKGMAAYWKRYYNTRLGAGTVEQWLADWKAFNCDAAIDFKPVASIA